jgi:hypothetical protein
VNVKRVFITIFSILGFLVFCFIFLLSVPWLFTSQHQAIAFLGIFLIVSTIPIMLFIFSRREFRFVYIIYYPVYFVSASFANFILSFFIQDTYFHGLRFTFSLSRFLNSGIVYFLLLFFLLQLPVIILCVIIKQIKAYGKTVNIKFLLKNPLLYGFIISLFALFLLFYF